MTEEMSVFPRIERVTRLNLSSFRGFGTEGAELDTDADIVLLTGPNGFGKSSVIEALTLLLTGHPLRDGARDLLRIGCDRFEIGARVLSGQQEHSIDISGAGSADWAVRLDGQVARPRSVRDVFPLIEEDLAERGSRGIAELDARLCVFSPEKIDLLYDERAQGTTVRQIFRPLTPELSSLKELLAKEIGDKLGRLRDKYLSATGESAARDAERARKVGKALASELFELYDAMGDSVELPEIAGTDALERLEALRKTWEVAEGQKSVHEILRRLKHEIREHAPQLTESAERREWESELKENQEEIDILLSQVRGFEQRVDDLSRLQGVLACVAESTAGWTKLVEELVAEGEGFEQLLGSLHRVRPDISAKRAAELDAWLGSRRETVRKLRIRQERKAELEDQIEADTMASEAGDWLRRQEALAKEDSLSRWTDYVDWLEKERAKPGNQRAKAVVEEALKELDRVLEEIASLKNARQEKASGNDKQLQEQLERRIEAIHRRFTFAGGGRLGLAQDLRKGAQNKEGNGEKGEKGVEIFRAQTADKRNLAHFSTGQRAQVAISLLLGQNDLVGSLRRDESALPHDLLLLDDVSTAYDLTNLTRETLLWRQLAYSEQPRVRRQLFISSHYEDWNPLIELLAPPVGGSRPFGMIVHRFVDWSLEKGPKIDSFRVMASGSCDETSSFERALSQW